MYTPTRDTTMEDLELRFIKNLPEDGDNYSLIFNDKKYNGWFRYVVDSGAFIDLIVRFRMPKTLPLYDDVARQFLPEERLIGIHRMLIGKDLREETKDLLQYNSVKDYVATLEDEKVSELLNRMKTIVTFDCNKIAYLHIRIEKSLGQKEEEFNDLIKKHIEKYPNYLSILYDVLNEKITMEEASIKSNGMIYNEYLQIISKN